MKFKSEVLTQASGSIGGVTYSHNRGGLYRRARSIPTNPNSIYQQGVRTDFGNLSTVWSQVLTQVQRNAWTAYAADTPTTDVLGDPLVLTGQQMFIRSNSLRCWAGSAYDPFAPASPGLTALSPVTATLTDTSGGLVFSFDNGDDWATTTGGFLLIQTSRFVSPGINFLRSPFRLSTVVVGDTTTPPSSPLTGISSNAFGQTVLGATGLAMFVRAQALAADGKMSAVQRFRVLEA